MYTIYRKLPSCEITADLLFDIERHVYTTAREIKGEPLKTNDYFVRWNLEEETGDLELQSIELLQGKSFENSTKSAVFTFDALGLRDKGCDLRLSLLRTNAHLKVKVWGTSNDRDRAIAMAETITDRFRRNANRNAIFHEHPTIGTACGLFFFLLIFIGGRFNEVGPWRRGLLGLSVTLVFLWLFFFVGSLHLPYSAFATRKNTINAKRFSKITWLLLGLFLTTIVAIFREHLFRRGP